MEKLKLYEGFVENKMAHNIGGSRFLMRAEDFFELAMKEKDYGDTDLYRILMEKATELAKKAVIEETEEDYHKSYLVLLKILTEKELSTEIDKYYKEYLKHSPDTNNPDYHEIVDLVDGK